MSRVNERIALVASSRSSCHAILAPQDANIVSFFLKTHHAVHCDIGFRVSGPWVLMLGKTSI